MKKWIITVLAVLGFLALGLTARLWVPGLLSHAVQDKERIESLKNLAELVSALLAGAAALFHPLQKLWKKEKEPAEKPPQPVTVQVINQPPTPPSTPVLNTLHQLPSPPADFTGREEERQALRAAILVGGITISGLQGQGGVGKTALALKLAEELTPNFPDAQIYLDLRGVSEKPLTPAEAMAYVIRTFHPEVKLPEREDELCGYYRSALDGKRALLLMDNARDAAQVRPLVPPPNCAFLVTSRQHFALPGLQPKNLDTLPPSEAKALLLLIAPRIDGEAEAIAKRCGYLPQALRLAATAIAERVDLAPADYTKRLANVKNRLKLLAGGDQSVDASINLSYGLLDTETQKRWPVLAVFPDTFDAPAAAAVWEMKGDAAQDALSRLIQYSMLEWNDTARRYRLHDLMRDFAREQLAAGEHDEAALRHAGHYLAVMGNAGALYLKGGESLMRGLALFDTERGNIQAGQAWAADHMAVDRQALQLCNNYPATGSLLGLRQRPRERIRWLEAALGAARHLKDRNFEAIHLGNLGIAHTHLGETHRAILYHEQALGIDREIADRRGEGQDLGSLGTSYLALGEARRAIEYLEQQLVIAREIGDRRGEGNALSNLGVAYRRVGETRRAIEYYEQALAIAREIGDRRVEGDNSWNMSLALDKLGERKQAIEHAEAALKIREEIEDPDAEKVRKQLEQWGKG